MEDNVPSKYELRILNLLGFKYPSNDIINLIRRSLKNKTLIYEDDIMSYCKDVLNAHKR